MGPILQIGAEPITRRTAKIFLKILDILTRLRLLV